MNKGGAQALPAIPKNMGKYRMSNGFATSPTLEFDSEEQAVKACEKAARSDNSRNWLYAVDENDRGTEIGYTAGYGEWKFVKTNGKE